MKALIRNEGETVTEDMDIPCIDWNTGYPLTNAKLERAMPYAVSNEVIGEEACITLTGSAVIMESKK